MLLYKLYKKFCNIKQFGIKSINHIDADLYAIQLDAVKQTGLAIGYIKNPSLEVQLAAVNQIGRAVDYIKKSIT